jgi:hypothetical protein
MRQARGNSGQASLEALFAIPLFFAGIFLLVFSLVSAKSFFWIKYQLHEAVICLQDNSETFCKRQFNQKISKTIPFCQVSNLNLQKNFGFDLGSVGIAIQLHKIHHFELQQKIKRAW